MTDATTSSIDIEPSDGVFAFYWTDQEELEWANGPFETEADAKAAALSDFETKNYGAEPGDTIYIVRADKRLTVAPDFDALTEQVLDAFGEKNEDCFGEDGFEGLTSTVTTTATQAMDALARLMQLAFEEWQSTHRKNIKVWCFGKVQDVSSFQLPTFPDNDAFIRERSAKSMGMTLEQFDALRAGTPTLTAGNTTTPTH